MLHILQATEAPTTDIVLRSMFAARKRVFVDLLRWEVPVVDGQFEIDEFDDANATYLVLSDPAGNHLASARLLPTTGPHILGSLFAHLCDGPVRRAATSFEITRFCLDRSLRALDRIAVRNRLVIALVEHGLARGITGYVAVAEMAWVQQILSFGWAIRPLGLPQRVGRATLMAVAIEIAPQTPMLLRAAGIVDSVPVIAERRAA